MAEAPSELNTGPRLDTFARLGGTAWRFVAIAVAVWILGTVFRRLDIVLVPITIALFLTTILWPLARFLRDHGWTPLLSTWAVFLLFLLVVAGLVTVALPELHREFSHLGAELNQSQDRIRDRLSRRPFNVAPADFDRYVNDVENQITANRNSVIDEVTASAELVLRAVAGAFLALVLTFFFLKDGDRMVTWVVALFDGRRAVLLRGIGEGFEVHELSMPGVVGSSHGPHPHGHVLCQPGACR